MSFKSDDINQPIISENDLRQIIPAYPKMLDKRIIPELDDYCLEIIGRASSAVFVCSDSSYRAEVLPSLSIIIRDSCSIFLAISHAEDLKFNSEIYASLYFLVPGVGHGLRINGRLAKEKTGLVLSIKGAYVHCARAAARSELWKSVSMDEHMSETDITSPDSFVKQSSFLMLKTMDKDGRTELSPRGDQKGFVQYLNENTLFIPERPGNKVAVSLRNIIANEKIELLMLIPGCNLVMTVQGDALLTADDALLVSTMVGSKKPKLGVLIRHCQFDIKLQDNTGISSLWQSELYVNDKDITKFSKVLSEHMNGRGLLGKATTPVVQTIVNHDMKNLY